MPYFPQVKLHPKLKIPVTREGHAKQLRTLRKMLAKQQQKRIEMNNEEAALQNAEFLFFFVPHLKLKDISRMTGVSQYKIKKYLQEKYPSIKSFKNYRPPSPPTRGRQKKPPPRDKLAAEARKNIRDIYQPYFIGKHNYFRKIILGEDLLPFIKYAEFPLTRRGDFDTSITRIMIRNLKKELRQGLKLALDKKRLSKAEEAMIDEIYEKVKKRLEELNFDIKLCPAYASKDKQTRGETRMIADPKSGKPFSRPVLNIPFYNYNPPKRIQEAAHNIAKKPDFELVHAEKPLVSAGVANGLLKKTGDNYDDIEGVNLKVRLPRTWEEFIKTFESGVVITKKAAEKLRYIKRSPPIKIHVFNPKDLLPEGTYVKRGDLLIKNDPEVIKRNLPFLPMLTSKYEGKIHYLDELVKQRRKPLPQFYTTYITIEREDTAKPGDKLFSRTGLKGVISEVIDEDPYGADLIINPLDIWQDDKKMPDGTIKDNEKKRRGAMVKEILTTGGYMYVTYEPGEFVADQISERLKISPTFLGGLAEHKNFEDVAKYIKKGNLAPYFEFMHLKAIQMPNGEVIIGLDKAEPKKVPGTVLIDYPHNVYKKAQYEKMAYPLMLMKVQPDQKGYPYPTFPIKGMSDIEKRKAVNIAMTTAMSIIFSNAFRPSYKKAVISRIVERPVKIDEIVMSREMAKKLGVKEGDWVTIRKEPVTSIGGIRTLKVKISDDVGQAFGLHPLLASEYMNADFDGDTISVFVPALKDKAFIPKEEDVKKKEKELKEVFEEIKKKKENWFNELEKKLKFVPDDILAKKMREYNEETYRHDNAMIEGRGGPRRTYFAMFPFIMEKTGLTPELVNKALDIEKAMKKKRLPPDRYQEMIKLFGKENVKKALEIIRKAEEEDEARERAVKNKIETFLKKYSKIVKDRKWILNIYREEMPGKSIAEIVGHKLYPDKFWIDRIFLMQIPVHKYDPEKDKDRFILKPLKERKKVFEETKKIARLRNRLKRLQKMYKEYERARVGEPILRQLRRELLDIHNKIIQLEMQRQKGVYVKEEEEPKPETQISDE